MKTSELGASLLQALAQVPEPRAAPLAASSGALADSSGQWPVGTYRAALTYTTSLTAAFSAGATIYSATFVVG